MQEIQLASPKSIMISGVHEISWYLFRRAVIGMHNKERGIPLKIGDRLRLINSFCWSCLDNNFPRLLDLTGQSKCTRPIDKVYGILGLAPRAIASKIYPDYLLSAKEVYKTTFQEYTKLVNRLELLEFCNLQHRLANMPSWVPNWTIPFKTVPLTRLGAFVSGFSRAQVIFQSPNILEVTGMRCSAVVTINNSVVETESDLFDIVRGEYTFFFYLL